MMIRFLEKYKISAVYVPKFMVKMRFGGASNSSLKALLRANKAVLRAFEKNGLKKPNLYFFKRIAPKLFSMIKIKLYIEKMNI